MKTKKHGSNERDTQHVTADGRSVMLELFSEEDSVELEIRATLLRGLERWLAAADMTQTEAAKALGLTQARISDLKRGKISQFSLTLLVRLAVRAGLRPAIILAAKARRD
jgi:predicted XRE-type DNA-binding protein